MITRTMTALVALAAAACASESKPATYASTTTETTTTSSTTSRPQRPSVDPVPAPTETQQQMGAIDSTRPDSNWGATPPVTESNGATATAPRTDTVTRPASAPSISDPGTAEQKPVQPADKKSTLAAADQGNSSSELKITANIRKQMVVDKALSQTAKNAKVITTGSKVTLRGSVKSEQEKTIIEQFARKADGVTDVDNQLEVKK